MDSISVVSGNYGNNIAPNCTTNGTTLLACTGMTGIDDNNWHDVDITFNYDRIIVLWDGAKVLDFKDSNYGTRDLSNTKFGFGSRTG